MNFIQNPDEFDQHFLVDEEVLNNFIKSANIDKNDTVIEIGPGNGCVTKRISSCAGKVICIEIDERLKPYLTKIEESLSNVTVIYGNVLDIDFPKHDKIVTSLPYSIIEPLIYRLSNLENEDITMIMGKKYVDSVINNEITMLSLLTNCYFNATKYFEITPESFDPKPRVMSAVINLKSKSINEIKDPILIVFRWMFYYKDKKNRNALIESLIKYSEQCCNELLTQRICKELIKDINPNILEEKFEVTSNKDLNELYGNVQRILTKIS